MSKIIRTVGRWPVVGRPVRILVAIFRLPEIMDRQTALSQTAEIMVAAQDSRFVESMLAASKRLDELWEHYLHLNHMHHVLETQAVPELRSLALDINHRIHIYESQQLPNILDTLSDLNRRQTSQDHDADNLVKSVPVALRQITRELKELPALSERVGQFADWRAGLDAELERAKADLDAARSQLADLRAGLDAAVQSQETTHGVIASVAGVPAALSAVEERVSGLSESVSYLLERVEFVRRELMFEMRYGAHDPVATTSDTAVEKRIVSTDKFDEAKKASAVRLNLGCGHIPLPGYLNVDRRELPGVDIVAEVGDLPLHPGEADEVHSAHLLEHFPQEQLRRQLLPYWYGLLKKGGVFTAVVPDAEAMIREYSAGAYPYENLREVMYGGQDYDGDFHFNMFTPVALSELLREAGFDDVQVIESGRRNGACFEFELSARK